ncbi:hypothetical protein NBRC116602_16630 [Hyphomicrobiales bacterium 4NK60-0047b]
MVKWEVLKCAIIGGLKALKKLSVYERRALIKLVYIKTEFTFSLPVTARWKEGNKHSSQKEEL